MAQFDMSSFDMEAMFQKWGNIKQIIEQLRETLRNKVVEAYSEDKSICVKVNGNMEITEISIEPAFLAQTDSTNLSASLTAVSNSALQKAQKMAAQEVSKLFGGIDIPALGGLFPPGLL